LVAAGYCYVRRTVEADGKERVLVAGVVDVFDAIATDRRTA